MLPAVDTPEHRVQILVSPVILGATTLVLAPVADLGWIYLGSAVVLGAVFT